MSYEDSSDMHYTACSCGRDENDGVNYCEICKNCHCGVKECNTSHQLVKINDGDYIKYRCADCLNDDDTVVIALEAAIGQKNKCHKCGLDTSNKPFSKDKTFVVGGKVLHWECLEDIVRDVKLPDIIDMPDLQKDSENAPISSWGKHNDFPQSEKPFVTTFWNKPEMFPKCCEHAVTVPCVCTYSYKCDVCTNGLQVCHGSHS